MTKSELIEVLAAESNLTRARVEFVVNAMFDAMLEALRRGEGIEIRGFGSFSVRQYKSYEGRNPRTGDTVHVAPKRLPFFKVGKELRERVNRAAAATPVVVQRAPAEVATPAPPVAEPARGEGSKRGEDVI